MAINKNFVVKNGLEVNTQLIYADGDTNKVGIASTAPNVELDVRGGIAASNTTVAGVSTVLTALRVGNQEGRVLTILAGSGQTAVGIGTTIPEFLLDVRSYDGTGTGKTAMHVYGDVRITGDLSMDDLTLDNANLTSLVVTGMSTFQDDVAHEGSRVGVTSFLWDSTEDSLEFLDHTKLTFGDSKDLQIYHDASESLIQHNGAGDLRIKTAGTSENLYIDAAEHAIIRTNGTDNAIYCTKDGRVALYYDNALKLETTPTGIWVYPGISTFFGSVNISTGCSVTGLSTFTGNVDINSDVDINRSLAITGGATLSGLSTFSSNVDINSDVDINRSLTVTGGTTLSGLSTFSSPVDINSDVAINDSTSVGGGFFVTGISTFSKNLDVNADVDISRSLTVSHGIQAAGLSTFSKLSIFGATDYANYALKAYNDKSDACTILAQNDTNVGNVWEGFKSGPVGTSTISAGGTASFAGDLTAGGAASIAGIGTYDSQGIRLAGVMTATKYYGDGNGLYGVVAETSYAVVSGMATVAMGLTAGISIEGVAVTGVSTFQYMNITGICSAKGGINIGAGTGATIFNPSGSGNEMTFGTNNVERMRFTSDGKSTFGPYGSNERGPFVQISRGQGFDKTTLNPATCFLHLGGKDNSSSDGFYGIGFGYIYGNPATTAPAYIAYEDRNTSSYTYGDLTFWTKDAVTTNTNAIERLRIKSGGYVGIGTTAPESQLHLKGSGSSNTIIMEAPVGQPNKIQFQTGLGALDAEIKNESSHLYFSTGTTPTERVQIDNYGYVGITSTNPTVRLDISSNDATVFKMDAGSANGGGMAIHHQNTVKGYFGVAGSNYLSSSSTNDIVLRAENRLDVAVSNTKKLDVNGGGINVTGIITASGTISASGAAGGLLTEINTKASTGKAIAMAMIFGG